MKKITSILLLVIMVFSAMSVSASENVIYVSKIGSDITGDGSEENPYCSIEKAKEEEEKAKKLEDIKAD